MALPRLKALPSTLQRLRALLMAVVRPPYSMISVYLFGPPVILLLLLLAYDEYVGTSAGTGEEAAGGVQSKAKAKSKAKAL